MTVLGGPRIPPGGMHTCGPDSLSEGRRDHSRYFSLSLTTDSMKYDFHDVFIRSSAPKQAAKCDFASSHSFAYGSLERNLGLSSEFISSWVLIVISFHISLLSNRTRIHVFYQQAVPPSHCIQLYLILSSRFRSPPSHHTRRSVHTRTHTRRPSSQHCLCLSFLSITHTRIQTS